MKYTTSDFRIDTETKTIEVYKPTNFIEFYKALVQCWGSYTPFSACAPFPNEVTAMFPVTPETMVEPRIIKL